VATRVADPEPGPSPRPEAGPEADPECGGGGRWRQPALGLVVVLLALVAIGTLIVQARALDEQIEARREAQSDNRIWLTAQLEVDLARLEAALHAAAAGGPPALARQRLDIFASRASLIGPALSADDPLAEAGVAALALRVAAGTGALAAVIDGWADPPSAGAIAAAQAMLARLAPTVRDLSLAMLAGAVVRETADRETMRALLGRFAALAILLVLLLSGVVLVIANLYRDLARQMRAARRIGSNLERTIEAARDAVLALDDDGRIRSFNAAAERMFALPRAAAIGRPAAPLLLARPTEAAGAAGPGEFAPPKAPGAAGATATGRRGDGRIFPMEVSRVTDADSDGRPVHFVILRDISDRVAAENGLRAARDAALQSAAMRARFLAVMSHEMRTPLNGVIAAHDLMQRGPLSRAQRRLLAAASTSAGNALRQIDDLLDLYRQDGSGAAEPVAPFDPAVLLADAVEVARAPAEQRGNRLVLELPEPGPGRVLGRPRAFARAVANLVSNAVKFTRDGRVTLRLTAAAAEGDTLILGVCVSDTGPGIAPADQARIFEDFETVDRSPSGGSGLGLGIAQRAVRAMGGALTLESAPGAGATFRFTARVTAATPAAPPLPAPPPVPRLHVLLAEDNPINRQLMEEMLRRLGHGSVCAADGEAAVAAARAGAFDALIVDLMMPGTDGIAAIAAIRAAPGPSRQAPALVVTAEADAATCARLAALEATALLLKPLGVEALGRALAALVAPPNDPLIDRAVLADARALLGEAKQAAAFADFAAGLAAEIEAGRPCPEALHRAAGAAAILGARRLHRLLVAGAAGQGDPAAIRAALAATRLAWPVAALPATPAAAAG
jgi:PAS domain S-box-containing protein